MAVPAALETIRDKVRKVTGRYSVDQLTDDQIDKYINDFYVYNLPDEMRTFRLRVPYNFVTVPNQDTYNFPYELYNSVEPSVYVGGYNARWFQSRSEFYGLWPKLKQILTVNVTDLGANTFSGTINQTPILRAQIAAVDGESTDPDGEVQTSNVMIIMQPPNSGPPVIAQDTAFSGNVGTLSGTGIDSSASFINYITGEFEVKYTATPPANSVFSSQIFTYGASRPISVLFFNNQFVFRPVPDNCYPIEMVAYKTPTQLLAGDDPALREWWMLLAYGASTLVYGDFPDPEGMAHAEKELQKQIDMMESRTVKQLSNERAATIISTTANPNYMGYFLPFQGQ